jgi:hypothetical protein
MEKSKNRKIPAIPICFVNKSENALQYECKRQIVGVVSRKSGSL